MSAQHTGEKCFARLANWLTGTVVMLLFVLSGCVPPQQPTINAQVSIPAKTVTYRNKSFPLQNLPGELSSSTQDSLRFRFEFPSSQFSTQVASISDIAYLRLWVKGPGIQDKVWNDEGYVKVVGNPNAILSIRNIARGPNRIVTAQAFDINQNLLPGLQLKAYYSSPSVTSGLIKIKLNLSWRFVPVATAMEQLLDANSALIQNLNPEQLQSLIDPMIFGNNPVTGDTFAIHPSRISASQIFQTLNNGGVPTSLPGTWNPPAHTATLYIKNAMGTNFNSNITVTLNDPASSVLIVPAGNDQAVVTGISPGTWKATIQIDGLNGGVSQTANVTVSQSGTVTLTTGSMAMPFKLPPVITQATSYFDALPRFLLSRWDGENSATDGISGLVGVLKNGAGYGAGWQGQGFALNGTNHYVELPNTGGKYDFGNIQDFSFGVWFKSATATVQSILSKEDGNKPTWGVMLRADGKLESAFQSLSGDGPTLTSTNTYNDNKWHHVMVTVNRSTNQAMLFVDGNKETLTGSIPVGANFTELATKLLVGARNPATPDRFFNGTIDDVQIYKKAVSASEILSIYRLGQVILTGDGFDPIIGNNTVTIGGSSATILSASGTVLQTVPALAVSGSQAVTVTTATQTSNSGTVITAPPVIAGLSNTSGIAGNSITINGINFSAVAGNNTVKFNGISAAVTAATTNSLTVTVPAGFTSGPITVTTISGTGTSSQTYTTGAPTLGGVPASALTTQEITITGSNFDRENPSANQVTFNGAAAVVPNSVSADGTSLKVTVPTAAITGTVIVSTGGGNVTSASPITLTQAGTAIWTSIMGSGTFSSPAMANDGTIYIGAGNNLYAYNPDGTLKWNYATGGLVESSPAIGSDGTIYVGSYDNKVYAVNPNGTLKWNFTTGGLVLSSPAIAPNGTIYVGSRDNKFYALNPDGTQLWAVTGAGNPGRDGTATIGSDGTIYIGGVDFHAYNPDGTLKWTVTGLGGSVGNWSGSAIGSDGTVYVYASAVNRLYAFNPDGTQKWFYSAGNRIWSGPAIGTDGTIYVGSWDNKVHAINPDGTLKWTYTTGGQIDGGIAIGADGLIYVGSQDGKVYALKADGTQQWNFIAAAGISFSTPNLATDGTLYVGTTNGRLQAIRTTSLGLANSTWPKDRGNRPNTSVLAKLALTSFTPGAGTAGTSVSIYGNQFTGATAVKFNGINATSFTIDSDNKITAIAPAGTLNGSISVTTPTGTVSSTSQFNSGALNWSTTAAGGQIMGQITVGSDGTVYVGISANKVNAYNPDGTLKWSYNTGCDIDRSVSIAADGTVYTNCNNSSSGPIVRALNADGTLRWNAAISNRTEVTPVVGSDGTIYTGTYGTQSVYAYNPDGTLKWTRAIGGSGATSVVISTDGTIYAQINSSIYALNPLDGTIKWNYAAGGNGGNWGSAAVGSDGTIYFASTSNNKIYAVRSNGTLKWDYTGTGYILQPVIGADGTIYAGDTSGKIYAVDSNGVLKWTFQGVGGIPGQTAAVVGSDGLIYFGTSSGKLYALNPNGTMAWSYTTTSGISSTPALVNGVVYIGDDGGKLYAVSASSNGYANSSWPRPYATNDSRGMPNLFHTSYFSPTSGNIGTSVKIYGHKFTGATTVKFANTNATFTVDSDTQITASVPAGATTGKISVTTAAGTASSTQYFGVYKFTLNPPGAGIFAYGYTATPAIATDGTIYIGGIDGFNKLLAYNPNGTAKWEYNYGSTVRLSAPSVGADGTIYSCQNNGNMHAVNPNGTLKWLNATNGDSSMAPAITNSGTVVSGKFSAAVDMYGYNLTGTKIWTNPGTGSLAFSGAVVSADDNSVYITGLTGLYRLNPLTGAVLNTFLFAPGPVNVFAATPAIGADGTIYTPSNNNNFYALNPDLTIKWAFAYDGNDDTGQSSPAIATDGTIYVGTDNGKLLAIDPAGPSLKWSYVIGSEVQSSPAIDSNGIIYFGCNDNHLYALNPDGTLKWKMDLGDQIWANPTIANDGTLYVLRKDAKLFAIPTGSTGLANSPWPKIHKNLANNGHY